MPEKGEYKFENVGEFAESDDEDEEDEEAEEAEADEKQEEEDQEEGSQVLGEAEEKEEDEDIQKESKEGDKKKPNVTFKAETVVLTKEDARKCLNTVGKTLDGVSFAYINIDVLGRRLTDVSVIRKMKWVLYINVSENRLTSEALGALKNMTAHSLKADNNKIASLGFPLINNLKILSLKFNEIETTAELEGPNLVYLHLDNNKIKTLSLHFSAVPKLRCLTASKNQIKTINELQVFTIRELYLGGNSIKKLDGLNQLQELRVLNLRDNQIKRLKGFSAHMNKLNYINIRNNKIENIKEIKKLAAIKSLKTLICKGNQFDAVEPGEEDEESEFNANRIQVLARVPRLIRLDKELVKDDERLEAIETKKALDEEEAEEEESEESEDEGEGGEEEAEGDDDGDDDDDD